MIEVFRMIILLAIQIILITRMIGLDNQQQRHIIHKGLAGYVLPDSELWLDTDDFSGQPVAVTFTANGKSLTLPVEEEK